jgi:hypothetical protein
LTKKDLKNSTESEDFNWVHFFVHRFLFLKSPISEETLGCARVWL